MISRRSMLLGIGAACATALPGVAHAERVYNVMERRWEEIDPKRRLYMRKNPPMKFRRRTVLISTKEAPGTIVIDSDNKFLYYVQSPNRAIRYGIGVGREGFGWGGTVHIRRKEEWPTWTPPAEMRARERANGHILPASMKGGVDNPLGARAMYLFKGGQDTMYRIHGTNQPWSIGLNLSSGCFRMMNHDVEDLYKRADMGTKVIVVGPGDSASKYLNQGVNPLSVIFGG